MIRSIDSSPQREICSLRSALYTVRKLYLQLTPFQVCVPKLVAKNDQCQFVEESKY